MRVLVTAFEPYDRWEKNSSWEALIALVSHRGANPRIITRRYPVDLAKLRSRIETDLSQGVDAVLHLGQAPGISQVRFEAIAINVAGVGGTQNGEYSTIIDGAPVAYRTHFPIGEWAKELRLLNIPASVSYHAGTYLCNAAMFLSHDWFARRQEKALVGFMHLPLTPEQAEQESSGEEGMSTFQTSRAIGWVIDRILGVQYTAPTELA